jgi:RNA polymerase sigma factor (sigma-70 family)
VSNKSWTHGTIPFERLVAKHGPVVLRVCRAMLGPDEAEDAWSETFLAALRAYPELKAGSNVRAWLLTIARHKAIDTYRSRARSPVPIETVPEPSVTESTEAMERDEILRAALGTLPPKQRDAIVYHHIAGMPYAEVAVLLGNTESAARRAAADGMKRLRTNHKGATS